MVRLTTNQLVTAGTLLVRHDTVFPPGVHLDTPEGDYGWHFFRSGVDLLRLKADLSSAGWNYFYLASIEQTSLGGTRVLSTAMEGLTRKMERQSCNSMQIDKVASLSFCGIPYLKVSAHCCQIQNSNLLVDRTS